MYLMDLTMQQLQTFREEIDTIILPIGMIESHGPHCSLGTDVWIPRELVKRIDQVIGEKIMIAPEIPYGHSWSLQAYPGTIDISAEAFSQYVLEVCEGFYKNDFHNLVLLNGHGGNISSLDIVTEKLADKGLNVLLINWWMDYQSEIQKVTTGQGHGGEDETSLVLAINEKLADPKLGGENDTLVNKRLKYKNFGTRVYKDGFTGDSKSATAAKGHELFSVLEKLVLNDIEALWSLRN